MNSPTREERYAQAVTREAESGNLRKPVWKLALAEANGNETAARDHYLNLRVAQMVEQEVDFETRFLTRREALRKSDEVSDELNCRRRRIARLVDAVLVALFIIMVWSLKHR